MFNFLKKGPVGQVTAPVAGSYLPIEQVTDEVFASGSWRWLCHYP